MIKQAMLWEKVDGGAVRCGLCAHRCVIKDGAFGFCGVRENVKGELFTHAYGSVIANHIDPIEKKPFYHFLPGSFSYSIAARGCNFKCSFCQNWTISQAAARKGENEGYELKPEVIVTEACRNECRSISYTYTEPTIFFEYALETAKIAKKNGLYNTFVTNGFMTAEAVDIIRPYLDAANIDLKFFKDETYKKMCGGRLEPVLDTIRKMRNVGIWVEVTTLVVPGQNDSTEELRGIAEFLASTGKEIPWHLSRFHPDYKYLDAEPTPIKTLEKGYAIGKKAGLKYVYLGNVSAGGDTVCPKCNELLVERAGFSAAAQDAFLLKGKCFSCGEVVEGVWA